MDQVDLMELDIPKLTSFLTNSKLYFSRQLKISYAIEMNSQNMVDTTLNFTCT